MPKIEIRIKALLKNKRKAVVFADSLIKLFNKYYIMYPIY